MSQFPKLWTEAGADVEANDWARVLKDWATTEHNVDGTHAGITFTSGTVIGNLTVGGNTALGNAGSDTTTITGTLSVSGVTTLTGGLASGDISSGTVIATGAITARSLAARFNDIVNVKDYGAVGDGVMSDTVAIQAALDAVPAAGGTVFFPVGTYITGALTPKAETTLLGAHKTATTLKVTATTNGLILLSINSKDRVTLQHLRLQINGNSQVAVSVSASPEVTLEDVICTSQVAGAGTGLLARGASFSGNAIGCQFESLAIGAQFGVAADASAPNVWTVYGSKFTSNGTGVLVEKVTGLDLIANRYESNTAFGINSSTGAGVISANINIRGGYFESNTTNHIRIQSPASSWLVDHITAVGGTYSDNGSLTVWRGQDQGIPGTPFHLRTANATVTGISATGAFTGLSIVTTGMGTFGGQLTVSGDIGSGNFAGLVTNSNVNGNGLRVTAGSAANDTQVLLLRDSALATVAEIRTGTTGAVFNVPVTIGNAAADTLTVVATIASNLIFTDNTYDIGASGATRPRDLFLSGDITTGAPAGGTAAPFKVGIAAVVSPTAPNRTIEIDISGIRYFIHAKTTND